MAEEETEVTVDEDVPENFAAGIVRDCLLYTSPSPRDRG